MSNHFHTEGAKPKPIFLPTTAAMAAHWEVYFMGAGHFSGKSIEKNILHLMLNCVYARVYESGCPAGINFTTKQFADKDCTLTATGVTKLHSTQ